MADMVNVKNRNNGTTAYSIPEMNLKRSFAPEETKKIPLEELTQLSYIPGGEYILKNYLIVENQDALAALNLEVEPEYFYTEAEITKLLTEGSLDQLEDTLNFAPQGVIELIKKMAVDTELPDTRKRKMISEMTGFNIDNAINVNHIMDAEAEVEEDSKQEGKTRKAAPVVVEDKAPTRKAVTPSAGKYKVVSK